MSTISFGTALAFPFVGILVVLALGVVIGSAVRSRSGGERRAGPAVYFFYGVSLVCLVIGITAAGITVHAISELVGPAPVSFSAANELFPPCPTQSGPASSTSTTTTLDEPCTDYGTDGEAISSSTPLVSGLSPVVGQATLFSGGPGSGGDDQYISDAIAAGLFAVAAAGGFLLAWPRARRTAWELDSDVEARVGANYGYLVSALAALALLILLPVAADDIFRAAAPGVTQADGHADGVRGFITLAVAGALTAATLVYHLRYAGAFSGDDDRGDGDRGDGGRPDDHTEP